MFLGVDLGTSSVKTVIIDEGGTILAEASAPLHLSRPKPLWSEQRPEDWVNAAEDAIRALPEHLRAEVKGLGLSGQMHGAVLLDHSGCVLRPAILWNDGRAFQACADLEALAPELRIITGNKAMPGFTAPKLLWVKGNEPEIFRQVQKVLLPKDYLRLVWTGDYATDVSDASGTLWLDVATRSWSETVLAANALSTEVMPAVYEGPEVTGELSKASASRLGLPIVPVIAGGGDQAAGAIGAGVTQPGEASLALGTSGVLFTVTDKFRPNPEEAAHAFCHALPDTWHQMAVMLSAASAVDKVAQMAGYASPEDAYSAAESHGSSDGVLFLPYLDGERTPHDNPHACGAFFGLTSQTSPAALVHSALEGVAFAFVDGRDALVRAGGRFTHTSVIGGGARSTYWGKILASALDMPLSYRDGAEAGPAVGAARLALIGVNEASVENTCKPAPIRSEVLPDQYLSELYKARLETWRALYQATRHLTSQDIAA
ncbi:MAG: xylulokinase [Pseudomonadota bacterium]